MTSNEFVRFLDYHRAGFTFLDQWLAGFDEAHEANPDKNTLRSIDVLERWRKALYDVSIDDAKKASDLIVNGDRPAPKNFDSHPAVIRTIARELSGDRLRAERSQKYRKIDGQETYSCAGCRDEGYRFIVNPITLQAAREGTLRHPEKNPEGTHDPISAIAACPCPKGNGWRGFLKLSFNEQTMLEWNGADAEDPRRWERIQRFVNQGQLAAF